MHRLVQPSKPREGLSLSTQPPTERLLSIGAIVLYAGSFLALMWSYVDDFARERDPGVDLFAWGALWFVVPLVVGFGIGRYWAVALVVLLFISTALVSELEPMQREIAEVEGGPLVLLVITAVLHAPLLLVGAWIRKRLWPRAPSRGIRAFLEGLA